MNLLTHSSGPEINQAQARAKAEPSFQSTQVAAIISDTGGKEMHVPRSHHKNTANRESPTCKTISLAPVGSTLVKSGAQNLKEHNQKLEKFRGHKQMPG